MLICIMHAKAEKMLPVSLLPDLRGLELDPKINLFFVMAGFFARQSWLYLKRKNEPFSAIVFWRARAIRLWPAYWVCALATFVCIKYFDFSITPERLMPGIEWWKMLLLNMVPFTPEILRVFELPNAWPIVILVFVLLQAWTLALIMALFFLTPLIFQPWLYRALTLFSFFGLFHAYFNQDAYQGFLIIALPYFLIGGLAYDFYVKYWEGQYPLSFTQKLTLVSGAGFLILLFAHYQGLVRMVGLIPANFIGVAIGWVLIPGLFQLTRNQRYDIYISNLSYTLYLVHFLVFFIFRHVDGDGSLKYWLVLPACMAAAILLHEVLEKPIRYYRDRIR
jgi:peptidoglycan/LPS O-acetylase OafA/YrhL